MNFFIHFIHHFKKIYYNDINYLVSILVKNLTIEIITRTLRICDKKFILFSIENKNLFFKYLVEGYTIKPKIYIDNYDIEIIKESIQPFFIDFFKNSPEAINHFTHIFIEGYKKSFFNCINYINVEIVSKAFMKKIKIENAKADNYDKIKIYTF